MGQGADRRSVSSPGPATGIRALVGDGGTGQPETKQDGNPRALKKSLLQKKKEQKSERQRSCQGPESHGVHYEHYRRLAGGLDPPFSPLFTR